MTASPTVHETLTIVLKKWAKCGGRSSVIPKLFSEVVEWWINHQEPAKNNDIPQKYTGKGGEVVGWHTPYHDRLAINLRTFLELAHIHQVHVIEKIEDGIPWRGDGMGMFKEIVKEAELMARDKDPYIHNAFRVMKSFRFEKVT